MILFSYFRSSASFRVRLALALKSIRPDEVRYVNLREGQQHDEAYRSINPQKLVPALALDDGALLSQSIAIMEYLEETYTDAPKLLPADAIGRARVRSIAQYIACELQPLGNLRVLNYLTQNLAHSDEEKQQWLQHWLSTGLAALEAQMQRDGRTGTFCHGDNPTMADCCLLPQIFAAQRFGVDLTPYPTLRRIQASMLALEEIQPALPANQPDAI
jgi:maleylpyruvate isomerase